jgi:small subunit ribosomal protein S4
LSGATFRPGSTARTAQAEAYRLRLADAGEAEAARIYGLLERQFRNLFEKAAGRRASPAKCMLSMLERRLDNVVYRMGFGTSRAQCRQMVRHGHIQVNGRKVNIPSYMVKPDDVIEVREKSRKNPAILAARDATAHAPAPNWLEVDREACGRA